MALQKNLQLNNGVSGNYWKITGIIMDFIIGVAEVHIALYLSKAIRDGRATPISNQTFTYGVTQGQMKPKPFPFTVETMDKSNPIAIAYNEIKKELFFQDAEDV